LLIDSKRKHEEYINTYVLGNSDNFEIITPVYFDIKHFSVNS